MVCRENEIRVQDLFFDDFRQYYLGEGKVKLTSKENNLILSTDKRGLKYLDKDIYKVEIDETTANLYGESTTKYFGKGFRVNCLILYNEPTIEIEDGVGPDLNTSIEMYFHRTLSMLFYFPK